MINTSQTIPLKKLSGWDKNPRGIKKDDYNRLKKQIQDLGVYKPLLVNEDYVVLGGNMRLKVLTDLGVENVWVSVVKASTPEMMAKYALSDNDKAGYYEEQALAELVQSVDIDLGDFKVDIGQPLSLKDLLERFGPDAIEDEAPEVSNEPAISQLGEVYQLGRHRLMCGDATKIEDVEKLMDGKKADMVFTDPPYGMDLDTDYTKIRPTSEKSKQFARAKGETTNKNYSKVIGDDSEWIFNTANHFDCDEQFWWGADWYRRTLPAGGSWFVWDKRTNDDGTNLDEMFGSCFELCWSKTRHKRDIARIKYAGLFGTEREDVKKRLHPTQKPILLAKWFFDRYGKSEDIVADLFGGSGSTLIACEQTKRICYTMELDPKYCDVIRKRYAKFIGKEDTWKETTVLINS